MIESLLKTPLRILFLCTANSYRSQMAEGWARHLHPCTVLPFSAGSRPSTANPMAVRVMHEVGVDLSCRRSKHLTESVHQEFDYVVTLCENARDNCPTFLGAKHTIHAGFPTQPGPPGARRLSSPISPGTRHGA